MRLFLYIIIMLSVNYHYIYCTNNYNYRFPILNKLYKNRMMIRNESLKPLVLGKSNISKTFIRKCRYLYLKANHILINYYSMQHDENELIELIIGLLN